MQAQIKKLESDLAADNLHQSIDAILEEQTMFGYSAGDVALGLAFWERVDDINNAKALIIWAAGELQGVNNADHPNYDAMRSKAGQ